MDLRATLQAQFKHDDFRFTQKEVIERALAQKNTLALMPTGAGKSLTYQFVSHLAEGNELVLVISPLIALMQDQAQKANEFNLDSTYINSSLTAEQKHKRMQQIAEGRFKLVFVQPFETIANRRMASRGYRQ